MTIIHKLIEPGAEGYLPFMLARERVIRSRWSGDSFKSYTIKYDLGDVAAELRMVGNQSFIRLELGKLSDVGGYLCLPHSDGQRSGATQDAQGNTVPPEAIVQLVPGGLNVDNNTVQLAGGFDWVGGPIDKPRIVSLRLRCDRYGFAAQVSPTDTYYISGKKFVIRDAAIVGIGIFKDANTEKLIYAHRTDENTVDIRVTGIGSTSAGVTVGTAVAPPNAKFLSPWIFSRDGTKVASVHELRKDVIVSSGGDEVVFRGAMHRGEVFGAGASTQEGAITFTLGITAAQPPFAYENVSQFTSGEPGEYASKTYTAFEGVNGPVTYTIHHGRSAFSSRQTSSTTFTTLIGNDFDELGNKVPLTGAYSDVYGGTSGGTQYHTKVTGDGASGPNVGSWSPVDMLTAGQWVSNSGWDTTRTITNGGVSHVTKSHSTTTFTMSLAIQFDGPPTGSGTNSTVSAKDVFQMLVALDGRDKQIGVVEFTKTRELPSGGSGQQWVESDTAIDLTIQTGGTARKFSLGSSDSPVGFAYDVSATSLRRFLAGGSSVPIGPIGVFHAGRLVDGAHYKSRRHGKEFVFSIDKATTSVGQSKTLIWRKGEPSDDLYGEVGTAPSDKFNLNREPGFAINPITIF